MLWDWLLAITSQSKAQNEASYCNAAIQEEGTTSTGFPKSPWNMLSYLPKTYIDNLQYLAFTLAITTLPGVVLKSTSTSPFCLHYSLL